MGYMNVNRLRLVLGLVLLSLCHLILFGRILPTNVTNFHLFWFGISGIIGFTIGDSLLFKSFVLIGARIGMLVMSLVPIFGTIIAWLFLHEILSLTDILAIIIIIAGISWVILERKNDEHERGQYFTGVLCGIGAAVCQALGLILSKMGLENNFSALAGNIIRIFFASIAIWIFALFGGKLSSTIKKLKDKKGTLAMCGGAFFGPFIGVWFSLVAVQYTYVGIASTLMALPPIFLIPLSHWVFKEKIRIGAVVGTIIAVIGVALIFLV
jgi:drug/metabolite transporter (DMT)-like permease